ncbi:MAG: ankyrin repeat domain-containing protein, partial [Bacteroidota bacterium]
IIGLPQLNAAQQAYKYTSQKPTLFEEQEGKMSETQQYNTPEAPKGLVYNHSLHIGKYVNNEVEDMEEEDYTFKDILNDDILLLKNRLKNSAEELILASILQGAREGKCYKYLFSNKGLIEGKKIVSIAYNRKLGYQLIKTTSYHVIVSLLEWLQWSQQQSVVNNEFFKTYAPKALSTNWPICKGCHLIALYMFKINLPTNEKGCLSQPLSNKMDTLPHLAQEYINNHLTLPLVEKLVVPMLGYIEESKAQQKQTELQIQVKQKESVIQEKNTALQSQQEQIDTQEKEIERLKLDAQKKHDDLQNKIKGQKEAINKLLPLFIKKEKEASSYSGMNSLHILVIKGQSKKLEAFFEGLPELAKQLVTQGVKNKEDWRYGFNAMHLAARYNKAEIVNVFFKENAKLAKTLATQGVQDNKEEYNGFNALCIAAYWRCTKVGKLLLKKLPELAKEFLKQGLKNRKLNNGFNAINISASQKYNGCEEKKMNVSDIIASQQVLICQGHDSSVTSVSWSHDDRFLASASLDNTVRVWDRHSAKQVLICQGHKRSVYSVSCSQDDRVLASASADNTLR